MIELNITMKEKFYSEIKRRIVFSGLQTWPVLVYEGANERVWC